MPGHVVNFFLIFLALIAYIVFTDSVGFIPVSFLILTVLMMRFGCRWVTAAGIGLAATLLIHTVFYKLLLVPLPWGILQPVEW
jgi:putative tricarboxylic transport membrane protein